MRRVTILFHRFLGFFPLIPGIRAKILFRFSARLPHPVFQDGFDLRDIMSVCSGHDDRQRDSMLVDQNVTLASIFFPIRGIVSHGFLSGRSLCHATVDALPSPGNAFHFVIFGQPLFPKLLEQSCLRPFLKVPMNAAGTAVFFRKSCLTNGTTLWTNSKRPLPTTFLTSIATGHCRNLAILLRISMNPCIGKSTNN